MPKQTDVRPVAIALYFLPIRNRVPLKFGPEVTTEVTCARVRMTVEDRDGKRTSGWGETPLSVGWVWPSQLSYEERHQALRALSLEIARAWLKSPVAPGHPMEVGHRFQAEVLPKVVGDFNNRESREHEKVPLLAALVCTSAFDLALHDAYGVLHGVPTYETYNQQFMNVPLHVFLKPAQGSDVSFADRWPEEFLVRPPLETIPAWHLIGGNDPIDASELTGTEPDDGYPVLLRDWIIRDGLKCLKVKLRGDDMAWDYDRLLKVGKLAIETQVDWLTADFNCTVEQPEYVNTILDRLLKEQPRIYGMMLYVEQPFPYDLEAHRIDVHSVSARKPLFMDESITTGGSSDWVASSAGRASRSRRARRRPARSSRSAGRRPTA